MNKDQVDKVNELAQSLLNSGLASSMSHAVEKAKEIIMGIEATKIPSQSQSVRVAEKIEREIKVIDKQVEENIGSDIDGKVSHMINDMNRKLSEKTDAQSLLDSVDAMNDDLEETIETINAVPDRPHKSAVPPIPHAEETSFLQQRLEESRREQEAAAVQLPVQPSKQASEVEEIPPAPIEPAMEMEKLAEIHLGQFTRLIDIQDFVSNASIEPEAPIFGYSLYTLESIEDMRPDLTLKIWTGLQKGDPRLFIPGNKEVGELLPSVAGHTLRKDLVEGPQMDEPPVPEEEMKKVEDINIPHKEQEGPVLQEEEQKDDVKSADLGELRQDLQQLEDPEAVQEKTEVSDELPSPDIDMPESAVDEFGAPAEPTYVKKEQVASDEELQAPDGAPVMGPELPPKETSDKQNPEKKKDDDFIGN
ncbi:hypothetical protein H6504_04265 [Candidatus Woesearchaeota archaeon]|nr:hypothetical protein [Candidatus Woesearchaeota archaeon]